MKSGEKGIISLFVLFIMLFLLIFTLTIYSTIKNKKTIQNFKNIDLEQIYSKDFNEIKENLYAENDSIIPIYNVNQLNVIGTGAYIEIKNKIYKCSIGKNYELKNNIIIDVNEDLNSVNINFNDYKFYLDTYHINKSMYDCYYFYNNTYWKVVAYQNFRDEKVSEFVSKYSCEKDNFFILNKINFKNSKLEFLNIIKNSKGEISNIYQEEQYEIPKNLNEIQVFNKHSDEIKNQKGEYYILINVGNNI